MANNFYDATGVLALSKVTEVITALFGRFKLDETNPDNGHAYIAQISEVSSPQWDDILEDVVDLISKLGLSLPEDSDESMEDCLEVLASHFNVSDNATLKNFIEHYDFAEGADLSILFDIALQFDDGHGLKAIQVEGSWHSDQARLFEFGGDMEYRNRHFSHYTSTQKARSFATAVGDALDGENLEQASQFFVEQVNGLLAGIKCEKTREALRVEISKGLTLAAA